MERQRKNLQSKGMEDSLLKDLKGSKQIIRYKIQRAVIRMQKELTDNYKKLSENYNSAKKEIQNINKNQEEMKLSLIHISEPTRPKR